MKSATIELDVQFHDCDPMNVAWHGSYVKYLEVARCALLESFNYNYDQMFASGYAWPVVDMRIKYIRPARFKQRLAISATLVEWEHRLKISYELSDAVSGERLSKATTTQMAVNMATEETCFESPQLLLDCLGVER